MKPVRALRGDCRGVLRGASRGVSLIEALVALAVMGIGLLGVVGMQASLRTSADNSKQRSEAVRLAQEKIEDLRAFGELEVAASSLLHDYTKIVDEPAATVVSSVNAGYGGNATFTRTVKVTAPTAGQPKLKTVAVKVAWNDRLSSPSASASAPEPSVELFTTIAELAPELGATLGLPANLAGPQSPGGRNPAIPRAAVRGTGANADKSIFTPPGGAGVTWYFKNDSGLVTKYCSPSGSCTGILGALLSGYVRFATGALPTSDDAETPPSLGFALGVEVDLTYPYVPGSPLPCFTSTSTLAGAGYVAYYCLLPLIAPLPGGAPFAWSGRPRIAMPAGQVLSSSLADTVASNYKVCRYTPDPSTDLAVNAAHPLDYVYVNTSLNNQNFLVISAGDGNVQYDCPTEDNTVHTPLVNGNTRRHQPLT